MEQFKADLLALAKELQSGKLQVARG